MDHIRGKIGEVFRGAHVYGELLIKLTQTIDAFLQIRLKTKEYRNIMQLACTNLYEVRQLFLFGGHFGLKKVFSVGPMRVL